jgi:opacity protein-like surface antigen
MKSLSLVMVVCLTVLAAAGARAQFKPDAAHPSEESGGLITQPPSTMMFGWFDPSKFQMHHSFELSYQSFAGQGMSLGTYTNTMMYQFADNLNARADVSMSFTPTNTQSAFGTKGSNNFSGIYLKNAELSYRPWDNVKVQLQYSQLPYGSYYYSPFYSPMFRENGF